MSDALILTQQAVDYNAPAPQDKALGVSITCIKCGTIRVFKIDASMSAMVRRRASSLSIKTTCEVCQATMRIWLGWFDEQEGYSYREIPSRMTMAVEDTNGLKEPEL